MSDKVIVLLILSIIIIIIYYSLNEKFDVVNRNKKVITDLQTSPKEIIKNIGTNGNTIDYIIEENVSNDDVNASNDVSYLKESDFGCDDFDKSNYFKTITRPLIPKDMQYI
jgi:hypothetical protein